MLGTVVNRMNGDLANHERERIAFYGEVFGFAPGQAQKKKGGAM